MNMFSYFKKQITIFPTWTDVSEWAYVFLFQQQMFIHIPLSKRMSCYAVFLFKQINGFFSPFQQAQVNMPVSDSNNNKWICSLACFPIPTIMSCYAKEYVFLFLQITVFIIPVNIRE